VKLQEEHVKSKAVVGHLADGRPIVMVETHGGLFAFFTKSKDGSVETLAAAPHRAVGAFLCEQKEKGIKWNKKLEELSKSAPQQMFEVLRARILSPVLGLAKSSSDLYLYYDYRNARIEVIDGSEIRPMLRDGDLDPYAFLRRADLSESYMLVKDYGRRS
jgi:hypothetical protein